MTLQQLKYFQVACKYKNITRATEELHVSQPSVSLAIKNLEAEFNTMLVRRGKTGFSLTEAGEEFLKLADKLLDHAENVEKRMKDIGKSEIHIRLGVPPMVGAVILPNLHARFSVSFPEIRFDITESGKYSLQRLLDDNLIDMAFLPHSEGMLPPDYESVFLRKFRTVCCVSGEHPLADLHFIRAGDLDGEKLVLFDESFFSSKRVLERLSEANVIPQISHRTSQLSTIKALVRKNLAVGFLFSDLLENESDLIGIPFEPSIDTDTSLVWKKKRRLTSNMKTYLEFIKTEIE